MSFLARVYKITCDCGCGQIYVGSTKQTLGQRMGKHRRNTKDNKSNTNVYKHARDVGFDKYRISLIVERKVNSRNQMRAIEHKYITEYDTVRNGLNGKLTKLQKMAS